MDADDHCLMLAGNSLIDFVNQNDHLNQTELARGAGYVRVTKAGRQQVLVKAFYGALLAARGTPIAVGKAPGKPARFQTTVHRDGVITLGRTYSKKLGLAPGDVLEIQLMDGMIGLVPVQRAAGDRG